MIWRLAEKPYKELDETVAEANIKDSQGLRRSYIWNLEENYNNEFAADEVVSVLNILLKPKLGRASVFPEFKRIYRIEKFVKVEMEAYPKRLREYIGDRFKMREVG